jgi:hypothetical protein
MNIGLSEFVIVLINLVFILAVPVIAILIGIQLFRRTRDLEARIAKLEGKQDAGEK